MIKPTNGRVVHFTPGAHEQEIVHIDRRVPLAAMVVHVFGDRLVNLIVFDSNGSSFGRTSVPLLQDDDAKPEGGYFCSWMEYQKGQAAKTEKAEAALIGARGVY
jgi:hypothetical protein